MKFVSRDSLTTLSSWTLIAALLVSGLTLAGCQQKVTTDEAGTDRLQGETPDNWDEAAEETREAGQALEKLVTSQAQDVRQTYNEQVNLIEKELSKLDSKLNKAGNTADEQLQELKSEYQDQLDQIKANYTDLERQSKRSAKTLGEEMNQINQRLSNLWQDVKNRNEEQVPEKKS